MQKNKILSLLESRIARAEERFPIIFEGYLHKCLQQLIGNTSENFVTARPLNHLSKILATQAILQKQMESSLRNKDSAPHPLFLRFFSFSSRICIALCCHDETLVRRGELAAALQSVLPGIQVIPNSFYFILDPDLPYMFSYIEVQKLRGDALSRNDLKNLEKAFKFQLHFRSPLTPALFWPYNKEESFKQVRQLVKEIHKSDDLPQLTIQFQEQTPFSLEFLIHLARPKGPMPLRNGFESLPTHLEFFCHFEESIKSPLQIDMGAFSLKIPSKPFEAWDSINLLYARRYVVKSVESIFGPCRDFNGGLFKSQQQHFERIRSHLGNKIPFFDLFAEKLFYALCPVEKRITLSLNDAEVLFKAFSNFITDLGTNADKYGEENVVITKATHFTDLPRLEHINAETKNRVVYARFYFCGSYFQCVLTHQETSAATFVQSNSRKKRKAKILRLFMEEGSPPSLNPHHSSGDLRCRVIGKLLFEGLVRLDSKGNPELAGAERIEESPCGTKYNFTLRRHRWSNGESVTAVDYTSSLRSALNSHLSHPELYYSIKNAKKFKHNILDIEEVGIRALDDNTLQLELERPNPHFLNKLAQPLFFPLFGPMQEPKWFNGPYLIHEQSSNFILLKRNPYYWKEKEHYFEEIEFGWHHEADMIAKLFKEGKIDWIGDPLNTLPPELIKGLENESELKQLRVNRDLLVYFKTTFHPLSSSLIRKALSLSIDRSFICENIYPHCRPAAPLSPLKEQANFLFEQGLKELGLNRETFPPLSFSFSHQAKREALAMHLQKVWKDVLGITLNLQKMDWNNFRYQMEKRNFEICCTIQYSQEDQDTQSYKRFEGRSSWNFSQWNNQQYKKIISQAINETDKEKQKVLLTDGNKILEDEVPFTSLFQYTHLFASSPELKGYKFDEEGCIDFSSSYF